MYSNSILGSHFRPYPGGKQHFRTQTYNSLRAFMCVSKSQGMDRHRTETANIWSGLLLQTTDKMHVFVCVCLCVCVCLSVCVCVCVFRIDQSFVLLLFVSLLENMAATFLVFRAKY